MAQLMTAKLNLLALLMAAPVVLAGCPAKDSTVIDDSPNCQYRNRFRPCVWRGREHRLASHEGSATEVEAKSRTAIACSRRSRSPTQLGEIEVTHFDDAPRTNSEDPANRGENMPRAVAGGFIDQNEMTADGYSCVS